MANEPIPVYVFTGFLESGKTKFIQDILADPNLPRTSARCCCCARRASRSTTRSGCCTTAPRLCPSESEDRLTPNILKRVEQKYQPDRILVEYNGMWKLES